MSRLLTIASRCLKLVGLDGTSSKHQGKSDSLNLDEIDALIRAAQFDRALEEIRRYLSRDPDNFKSYALLAKIFSKTGFPRVSDACAAEAQRLENRGNESALPFKKHESAKFLDAFQSSQFFVDISALRSSGPQHIRERSVVEDLLSALEYKRAGFQPNFVVSDEGGAWSTVDSNKSGELEIESVQLNGAHLSSVDFSKITAPVLALPLFGERISLPKWQHIRHLQHQCGLKVAVVYSSRPPAGPGGCVIDLLTNQELLVLDSADYLVIPGEMLEPVAENTLQGALRYLRKCALKLKGSNTLFGCQLYQLMPTEYIDHEQAEDGMLPIGRLASSGQSVSFWHGIPLVMRPAIFSADAILPLPNESGGDALEIGSLKSSCGHSTDHGCSSYVFDIAHDAQAGYVIFRFSGGRNQSVRVRVDGAFGDRTYSSRGEYLDVRVPTALLNVRPCSFEVWAGDCQLYEIEFSFNPMDSGLRTISSIRQLYVCLGKSLVNTAYATFLRRRPDAQGLERYTAFLESDSLDALGLVTALSRSDEAIRHGIQVFGQGSSAKQNTVPTPEVAMGSDVVSEAITSAYLHALNRLPDQIGLSNYLLEFARGTNLDVLVAAISRSPEATNRLNEQNRVAG